MIGWLYGAGFVQDPVVELGNASDRQWSGVHPETGDRVRYESTAVTHATRVTAPAEVPLNRFDVGALRRLVVGLLAGPMAEAAARGRNLSFEELVGLSGTKILLDRNSDLGQAFELCTAVVILTSLLSRPEQATAVTLPANWYRGGTGQPGRCRLRTFRVAPGDPACE